ncbi:MAG: hypothetical protein WC027_00205 [Candidatus Paceibacterota bacterium]
MSILEKIRQKDDRQKKIFSFVSALVLTLVILVGWLSLSNKSESNLVIEKQENKLSSVSPMQMIRDEFSKAFANFNQSVEIVSTTTEEINQ